MSIFLLNVQFLNCFIDNEKRSNRAYGKKYELNVFHDGLSYRIITQYGVLCLSNHFSITESKTYESEYEIQKEIRKIINRKKLIKKGYEKPYGIWKAHGPWLDDGRISLDGFQTIKGVDYSREFD